MDKGKNNKEQDEFENLKSEHSNIQAVIDRYKKALKEVEFNLKISMNDMTEYKKKIEEESQSEEYGECYDNIPLISIIFPNFNREIGNYMEVIERNEDMLKDFIKDLVDESNNIKQTIAYKPEEKTDLTDAEIKAFDKIQRQDVKAMMDANIKAQFYFMKNRVLKRAETDEQKKITDAVSLDIFGKKIGDVGWMIGGRKKKKK